MLINGVGAVPVQRWSRVAEKALRFAYALSQDVLTAVSLAGQRSFFCILHL
jgi:hypothetical protein